MCMYSDFTPIHANANPYDGILGIGVFSPLLSDEMVFCVPSLISSPPFCSSLIFLSEGGEWGGRDKGTPQRNFRSPGPGLSTDGNEVMQACWGRERRRGAEVLRHDGVVVILTSLHGVRRAGDEAR
jgi:hypothetical protein